MGEAKIESVQGGLGRVSKRTLALSTVLHFVLLHFCCKETLFFKRHLPHFHFLCPLSPEKRVRGHCRPRTVEETKTCLKSWERGSKF